MMSKKIPVIFPVIGVSFLLTACFPVQFFVNGPFDPPVIQSAGTEPSAISVNTNVPDISCGQSECAIVNSVTQHGISFYNSAGQLINYVSWGSNVVQEISCDFNLRYCVVFGAIIGFFAVSAIWELNLSTLTITTIAQGTGDVANGACTDNLKICFADLGNLWVSTDGGNSFNEISAYSVRSEPFCSVNNCAVIVNPVDVYVTLVYTVAWNGSGLSTNVTPISSSYPIDMVGCSSTCYGVYSLDSMGFDNSLPGARQVNTSNIYQFYPVATYINGIYCHSSCYVYGSTSDSRPAIWELSSDKSLNLPLIFNGNGVVSSISNGWVSIINDSGTKSVVEPLSFGTSLFSQNNFSALLNQSSYVYADAQINQSFDNEIKSLPSNLSWNTAISGDSISFAIMMYSGTLELGIDIGGCSIECFEQYVLNNHPVGSAYFNYFFYGYWDIPQFSDYIWQNHLTVYNDYLTGIKNYLTDKTLPVRILSVLYAATQDPKAVDAFNQGLQNYLVPQLQNAGYTNVGYCDINNLIYGDSFKYVLGGVVIRPDGIHPTILGSNYLAYVILNDCP